MGVDRIQELKRKIEALQEQWPAHSVPPAMLEQLDELEEELARAERAIDRGLADGEANGDD